MSEKAIYLLPFVLLLILTGTTQAGLNNDPALVMYYSFDFFEDVVLDESGKGHDATVKGNVTPNPNGHRGGAALFATGSYLDLDGPSIPAADIPTTGMTLAAWIKCENTGGDHAIFNARAGDSTWIVHPEARSNGQFRWLLRTSGGTTIFDIRAGVVKWDQWLHFAGTYDKATGKAMLYIDGEIVADLDVSSPPNIAGDWDMGARVGYNIDNARPFTGLMDDFCMFARALTAEEVQTLMLGLDIAAPESARAPSPEHEAIDVPREVALGWAPGTLAVTHDVYLGTVFEDVNDAGRSDPRGVLISQDQSGLTCDPEGLLEFGQTYYWRIDEVNGAPDFTIYKGDVWSFTTEPLAYPVSNVTATASSVHSDDMGPEKTVDASGLDAADEHSIVPSDMWLSGGDDPGPPWIQYEFDRAYTLHEMWVWNSNQQIESFVGMGARAVTVETSMDGVAWTALADVPELAQAPGATTYAANTVVAFGGVTAQFVKLTITDNWGLLNQSGLSEVRFFQIPTYARNPVPTDGGTDVALDATLSWRPGRTAAGHEVYFGTDAAAVADGTAAMTTVSESLYQVADLQYGQTYYWKVNEVNAAASPAVAEGDLWSFTAISYLVLDDMESYGDDEEAGVAIYQTWIDGWDNGSGATVGYLKSPFAEQSIIHGGKQSMPLGYNNAESPWYSEAIRTWDSPVSWPAAGLTDLVLYFRGQSDNTPDALYVVVEDSAGMTALVPHPDAAGTVLIEWQEWAIPLSVLTDAGVDVTAVVKLTIGVGDRDNPTPTAAGLIFIDDIRLGTPTMSEPAE